LNINCEGTSFIRGTHDHVYQPGDLIGRLVVAVVNFPPRQIGPFMSDLLTLGVPDREGAVILLAPNSEVPLGGKVF